MVLRILVCSHAKEGEEFGEDSGQSS